MFKIYITTLLLAFSLTIIANDVEPLSTYERYKMSVANRQFSKQHFPKAIKTYEELHAENKLSADYKNEYAIMLLTQGDTKEAVSVLQGANNERGLELLYNAYLYDNAYSQADSLFQLYPMLTNASITDETSLEAFLQKCNANKAYLVEMTDFNSAEMDFSPTVQGDNLYFASARGDVQFSRGDYNLTGGAYLDVYEVKEDSVSKVKGDVNQPYNDGPVAFSADGNVVLVTRNVYDVTNYGNQKEEYNALQIFKAVKDASGKWGDFEVLPFCSDDYSCNDPYVFEDELYFTSDMPGGFGGNDIYKIKVSSDITVEGEPQNLGADINTEKQEGFPFVDEDGVLYFASNGFIGFGGLDIYSATKNGSAYEVENMGYKINTNSDDFSLFIENKTDGYFASNRPGGIGSDDIYKYHIRPMYQVQVINAQTKKRLSDIAYSISELPEALTIDVVSDTSLFEFFTYNEIAKAQFDVPESDNYLAFNESVSHEDNLFTIPLSPRDIGVYGYVYNELTGERFHSVPMRIFHQDTLWAEFSSDDAGDYLHQLEQESDYRVVALVSGYLPSEADITTRGKKEWIEQNLPVAKMIELEGILYDFDKSFITTASAEILDNVVRLMNENPTLRIELGSHTDCRGSDLYNEALSDRRSKSAVKYIVDHGIDQSRLEAKAYGEYQLKNRCDEGVCCSIEEHHQNRRTEIKIID